MPKGAKLFFLKFTRDSETLARDHLSISNCLVRLWTIDTYIMHMLDNISILYLFWIVFDRETFFSLDFIQFLIYLVIVYWIIPVSKNIWEALLLST